MAAFFAGLGIGIFGGGALSYLYASFVIKKVKALAAAANTVAKA